mmetsp:Transcript_133578/g.386671  ORF Transcript_133578/g.386671 Transcript_133578/m.386671 type:complete len:223 (+) Transcript_133578:289-957(+)
MLSRQGAHLPDRALLHCLVHDLEGSDDELPYVDAILHGGMIGAAKLQHNLHEVLEGDLGIDACVAQEVVEDVVRIVDDADGVNPDVMQGDRSSRVFQNGAELVLGDLVVAVAVELLQNQLQLIGDELHLHVLLFGLRDVADDLAEDTDEHVHHSQVAQQDKSEPQCQANAALCLNGVRHARQVVEQHAGDQQRPHGRVHRLEVYLAHAGVRRHLCNRDCEDV